MLELLFRDDPVIPQHDGDINRAVGVIAVEDPGLLDAQQIHQILHGIRFAGVIVDRGRGDVIPIPDLGDIYLQSR